MCQHGDQFENIVDLSLSLNNLLQKYYDKTRDVNLLLEQDNEDSMTKIDQLLRERETIIGRYNTIKEKYDRVKEDARIPNLDQLKEQRRELLGLIRTIELSNLCKSNELFEGYKEKIRDLNAGKKAVRAYGHSGPLSDGFFVDKRK